MGAQQGPGRATTAPSRGPWEVREQNHADVDTQGQFYIWPITEDEMHMRIHICTNVLAQTHKHSGTLAHTHTEYIYELYIYELRAHPLLNQFHHNLIQVFSHFHTLTKPLAEVNNGISSDT